MRSIKATVVMAGAVAVWAGAVAATARPSADVVPQRTPALFTKAQADGASAQFKKMCAECHPFSTTAKRTARQVPLAGEQFFDVWEGRRLADLVNLIVLTMPNDGSATVTEAEAMNLVAYILQQNGLPAGSRPLSKATASAVLTRPKK